MTFLLLTVLAFACYALTTLITKSYALKWLRIGFRAAAGRLPLFIAQHFTLMFDTDITARLPVLGEAHELGDSDPPTDGFDFISCPMCVGFWVALAVVTLADNFSFLNWIGVYGLSYFIATQEGRW